MNKLILMSSLVIAAYTSNSVSVGLNSYELNPPCLDYNHTDACKAIGNNDLQKIKSLIEADKTCTKSKCPCGDILLFKAIINNNEQIFDSLIKNGCNPNILDLFSQTTLHKAAESDQIGNITYKLIKLGVPLNPKIGSCCPLHRATFCQNRKAIELHIQHGSDLNAKDCFDQKPLEKRHLDRNDFTKEDYQFINDLQQLNAQFNKEKSKRLFIKQIRYQKLIPIETKELFIRNMFTRGTVNICQAYPELSTTHFKLFNIGLVPADQLKILINSLYPVKNVSFIWTNNWRKKQTSKLACAIRSFYQHCKESKYKAYVITILSHAIVPRTLKGGPFSEDVANIINQYHQPILHSNNREKQ
jgi:hypothetical protein